MLKTERIFKFPVEKLEEKLKFEKKILKNVKKLLKPNGFLISQPKTWRETQIWKNFFKKREKTVKTEWIFNFPVEKLEEKPKFEKTFWKREKTVENRTDF